MIRVVIADNYEIVREGITLGLGMTDDIEVIGEASDGFGALKLCRTLNPDILLLDGDITRPNAPDTMSKIRRSCPDTMLIVMSSETNSSKAFKLLENGAVGFMPKQAKGEDFAAAIRAVSSKYTFLPTNLFDDFAHSGSDISDEYRAHGLSRREVEVLEASATGQSNKEVAQLLSISVRTVETHRNSIYRKTGANAATA